VDRLADTARFRLDDPDEVVLASLACPLCLRVDRTDWELDADADGYDPTVACDCRDCEMPWRVYLTPDQALRLGLMALRAR
jgi:hypothetical protein